MNRRGRMNKIGGVREVTTHYRKTKYNLNAANLKSNLGGIISRREYLIINIHRADAWYHFMVLYKIITEIC